MAEVLGVGLGLTAKEVTVGQRIGYSPITGIDIVQSARHLEDTPGLIDPDVTDEVRQLRAAVSGTESGTVRAGGDVYRKGAGSRVRRARDERIGGELAEPATAALMI